MLYNHFADMPLRYMRFETKAKLGYAVLALLLASGMAYSVRRFALVTNAQVSALRVEEHKLTLVERLRWNTSVLVSNGMAYLLSGEPELLREIRDAENQFEATLSELSGAVANARDLALVRHVQSDARAFRREQAALLATRLRSDESQLIVGQFVNELLPLRRELGQALDRLVDYQNAVLEEMYAAQADGRDALVARLYGLLALLVAVGVGLAWYFAGQLTRAYQKEAQALAAAEAAVAARDQLMAVVAHDLRNPLNVIAMRATLLEENAASPMMRKQAASIHSVTARMDGLIGTMLDATTIESGRFSVTPTPCDVDDLVGEATDLFGSLSASREVSFEHAVAERGVTILADHDRILQVFSNLLGNALKFTPDGGAIRLAAARHGGAVVFEISDSGVGISGEDLPHIFDRFWKHEVGGRKGTGLGLFICKGIVDAHGGRIWVTSEPGRGTTFRFTLPVVDRAADSAEAVRVHERPRLDS